MDDKALPNKTPSWRVQFFCFLCGNQGKKEGGGKANKGHYKAGEGHGEGKGEGMLWEL